MDRWKAEQGRGRKKRKIRRKKSRRERKKMQMREKVRKSRNTVFIQWFGAPEGRKVGSLKRRVRRQLARWEMKNCTPLWREAHFEIKMYKKNPLSEHFWKLRCWKSARRCGAKHISKSKCTKHTRCGPLLADEMSKKCTPLCQNAKNTRGSDHFWQLRCRKSARRCGAKHISKSKCTKHTIVGPLLEVEMSEKCTPLWREAHFQVKMYKTLHVRSTFGGSDVASLRFTTLHYTTLHSTTLHYTTLHHTPLHNTTTTTTQLHSTTLNYTTPHSTTLN